MSTLTIRKKSLKTWLHTDSILGNFIISKFYFNADNVSFQIVEQGQSKRVIYNITDITLYALPTGGTAETFGNIIELSLRLEELNYPAFQYDGQITSIANLIDAGTGVTITGDGTAESPYVINSSITQTPDATTSVKGKLKLAGDLSGTADLPTVPGLAGKQATLVSGTNIKTVNGNSLLGSGDIVVGGGGSQTLAEVLAEGNTTGGENIVINNADSIELENTSSLKKGTYNFGGNGGISRICSNNYEDMWQNGFRHVFDQSGFIRNSTNCFNIIPDETFDDTLRFKVDSLWTLDDGTTYVCIDNTTGAAVWELVNTGTTPTLQEVATVGNTITDTEIVFDSAFGNKEILMNVDDGIYVKDIDGDKLAFIEQSALGISNYDGTNTTFLLEEGFNHTSSGGFQKLTFDTIASDEEIIIPNASGTLALTSDITAPTLQEVLDNNHDLVDSNNFQGTGAGIDNTGAQVNAFGFNAARENTGNSINALGINTCYQNTGNAVNAFGDTAAQSNTGTFVNALGQDAANANTGTQINAFGTEAGIENAGSSVNAFGNAAAGFNTGNNVNALGDNTGYNNTFNNVNLFGNAATADEDGQTVFSKNSSIFARISTTDLTTTRKYNLPDADGTIALTSDIPTGGSGIPHATASGTDTYTATITGVTAYNDADAFLIRFTNGNTTGATLNINSLGAIPLYRNNDGVLIGGDIISGGEMLCVYNSTTNRFQVIGTAPNSLFSYVTNDDSVTLTKGMPVYAFSGTGDRMTVKRANNTGDATSAQTVGLVLSTSIAAGQKGLIMMQGLLDGLSILPTSTWADGDPVYLGATAGTITNVKPYAPNHLVYLGVVTTASNGSAGRMYVRVQNGYELSEIHNVQAQNPTLNDTLWYDDTVSPAQWKTASIPTILGYTPPSLGLVQAVTAGLQNIF